MDTTNHSQDSQEIDLSYLYKGLLSFLKSIEFFIYRTLQFIFKNIRNIGVLVLLGVVIGYFWDKENVNIYKHEIILKTNFNSSTYLYKKIESYNILYKKNAHDIRKIELSPIVDVVSFVKHLTDGNINIAKFLSENNISLNKYKKDDPYDQTSMIYNYHLLTLYTSKEDINSEIVNNFLIELNDNAHFTEKQKISLEQKREKLKEYKKTLESLNAYLEKISKTSDVSEKNVTIEIGTELSNLVEQKNYLQSEIEYLRIWEVEAKKTFFDVSILPNILEENLIKKKIILPILFVFVYSCLVLSIRRYKKYKLIF